MLQMFVQTSPDVPATTLESVLAEADPCIAQLAIKCMQDAAATLATHAGSQELPVGISDVRKMLCPRCYSCIAERMHTSTLSHHAGRLSAD